MAKIDAQTLEIMTNILKSPADTVAIVKGSNAEISISTATGITGLVTSLSSMIATNPELKAGLSKLGLGASVVALVNDGLSLSENNYNDKTITSLLANTAAVAGGIIALGGASVIASGLLVAGTGLALWSAYEINTDTDITDALTNFQNVLVNAGDTLGDSVDSFVNNINSTSDLLQEQYNDFINSSNETIDYNDWIADTNTSINIDDFSLVGYLKEMGVNSITNDNQTYTIKSGDTLWDIAQSSNVTVDELLQANPWLEEQGRVNEDKSYVLIKTGETINISKDNNTYSYDIENSSVSIKDASNNPLALESISNDMLQNISDGFTTLNTQTKTLDLNTMTTIDGGYGYIVNVKDTSGVEKVSLVKFISNKFYQANSKKVA